MRILSSLLVILSFITLAFISQAKADEGCKNEVRLSIALDTEHTTFKNHYTDVKKYREEHPFGTRDHAPLHIPVGDGNWCVSFGTLRDFKYAMPGITYIVVTVGDLQVVESTDANDFQVLGLEEGQEIRVEFIQLRAFGTNNCERKESDSMSVSTPQGRRPITTYKCDGPPKTTWRVVEERVYIVNAKLGQ